MRLCDPYAPSDDACAPGAPIDDEGDVEGGDGAEAEDGEQEEEEDEGRPAGFDGPPPGSPLDQTGRKTPLPALINITMAVRCSYARFHEHPRGERSAGRRTGGTGTGRIAHDDCRAAVAA